MLLIVLFTASLFGCKNSHFEIPAETVDFSGRWSYEERLVDGCEPAKGFIEIEKSLGLDDPVITKGRIKGAEFHSGYECKLMQRKEWVDVRILLPISAIQTQEGYELLLAVMNKSSNEVLSLISMSSDKIEIKKTTINSTGKKIGVFYIFKKISDFGYQ